MPSPEVGANRDKEASTVAEAKRWAAEMILEKAARAPAAAEDIPEGFVKERQASGQAGLLSLRFRGGRDEETVPWSLFARARWHDDGKSEQLALLFSNCLITVEGEHLRSIRLAHEEGQLKALEEHNERDVELLRSENADLRADHKKPIIRSIRVEPSFEQTVSAMKGEDAHETRFTRKLER
jgi:hypothetical protein